MKLLNYKMISVTLDHLFRIQLIQLFRNLLYIYIYINSTHLDEYLDIKRKYMKL